MPYWKTYYHLVTATAKRNPLIDERREPIIYEAIEGVCRRYRMPLLALGGVADHVHVVSITPAISISQAAQYIKGTSSRVVNGLITDEVFAWQSEYGIETFAERNLPAVSRYVLNQKSHHAQGTQNERLERWK